MLIWNILSQKQKGIESKGKAISKRAFILNIGKFSFGLLISRLTYLQLFEGKNIRREK